MDAIEFAFTMAMIVLVVGAPLGLTCVLGCLLRISAGAGLAHGAALPPRAMERAAETFARVHAHVLRRQFLPPIPEPVMTLGPTPEPAVVPSPVLVLVLVLVPVQMQMPAPGPARKTAAEPTRPARRTPVPRTAPARRSPRRRRSAPALAPPVR